TLGNSISCPGPPLRSGPSNPRETPDAAPSPTRLNHGYKALPLRHPFPPPPRPRLAARRPRRRRRRGLREERRATAAPTALRPTAGLRAARLRTARLWAAGVPAALSAGIRAAGPAGICPGSLRSAPTPASASASASAHDGHDLRALRGGVP